MKELSITMNPQPNQTVTVQPFVQELIYRFSGASEKNAVELSFPYLDCAGVWHPGSGTDRSNLADWSEPYSTMISKSAPVVAVFSEASVNRCTVALSEAAEKVYIAPGIHEEDGTFHIRVELPRMQNDQTDQEIVIRLDTRAVSFSTALREVSQWWEHDCAIQPMESPDCARQPMYSTWYSYHQMMQSDVLEQQCRLAAAAGFRTIIVDDGWQTDDNNRGYAFCGDWQPDHGKFPDMKRHVANVHAIGMKYMLWYSVPFVGKKSKVWERFRNKLLYQIDRLGAGVLDPRYPDVREYLVQTYVDAVKEYDIDGLKLDFIGQFSGRDNAADFCEGMDCSSVQIAVDRLMLDVAQSLKAIRPDIMLEFRQPYIGPHIRKYGNIFRVNDCPNSALTNRVGIVDLRLLSGRTAIHSDMLMWHDGEDAENIALQLIACIFSTVQISILLENMSLRQKKTLEFWLQFMQQNQQLLLHTPLEALEPHNLYPQVQVTNDSQQMIALYSGNRTVRALEGKKLTVLNGSSSDAFYVETAQGKSFHLVRKDCTGAVLEERIVKADTRVMRIPATVGGLMELAPLDTSSQ